MKITVLTGPDGEVHATMGHQAPANPQQPHPVLRLIPRPGQTLHEIELPGHLEKAASPEELHKGLKEYLGKHQK